MSLNHSRRGILLLFVFGFLAAPFMAVAAQAADVTVFAAASLKNALDDVAAAYKTKTGKSVTISYAGVSALAKQIEAGAPADIFFSADLDWMDYLAREEPDRRRHPRATLLGNTLVLVAPKDFDGAIRSRKDFPILQALGADGKLAMANVDSVPAGKYGKAALKLARRLGRGGAARGAGRQCARRARLRRQGRGAARHRLRDRRQGRAGGQGRSRSSRRTATRRSSIRSPAQGLSQSRGAKAFLDWLLSPRRAQLRGTRFSILRQGDRR